MYGGHQLLPTARDSRLLRHNIVVTSYSPLGSDNSPRLSNPIVTGLAEKYSGKFHLGLPARIIDWELVSPASILISLQANIPNTTGMVNTLPNTHVALTHLFLSASQVGY
jgi:hypothetical protein